MPTHLWQGTWHGRSPVGESHQRARQIISPSGGIVRGKFPSRKNGRMVHHEGLLELDAIYLFETSPRVVRYREQPTTIHYPDGDRLRRYTPDFELVLTTGEVILVEVKPARSLMDDAVRHKLDCVAAYLQLSARPFVILTEDVLRREPRQTNVRMIYHRAPRQPIPLDAARVALHRLRGQFPMSLTQGTERLARSGVGPYSLLLSGLLRCALDAPLDSETLLHEMEGHDDAWFRIAQEHGL